MSGSKYEIEDSAPPTPHGNTSRGLPFIDLEVGQSFVVPPHEYSKASSARAYFQKKLSTKLRSVRFSSRMVRDERGEVIGYRFKRES